MKIIIRNIGAILLFILWVSLYIVSSAVEKTKYNTDGEWLKVRKNAVIYSKVGQEDIATSLNPGDSVRLLGYQGSWCYSNCLVETSSGVRGDLQMCMLDIPLLASGGKYSGDTIKLNDPKKFETINGRKCLSDNAKITGVVTNGEKANDLMNEDFYPDVPDVFKLKLGDMNGFTKLMSKGKFEKIMENLHLDNAERLIGPVNYQARKGNNEVISTFRTYVYDPSDGKFYRPTVTFSADSLAVSSQFKETRTEFDWFLKSDWLIRILPAASWVYNLPVTSFFVRSDIYDPLVNPIGYISEAGTVMYWVKWVFKILGFFVWLFGFGIIPIYLLNFILVNYPGVFKMVSNNAMHVIFVVALIGLNYFWILATLAWGMLWLLVLVDIFIVICAYVVYGFTFWNFIPHTRCPNCKHIDTMEMVSKDFVGSTIVHGNSTETTTIGEDKKSWVEYTRVTQGNTSWRENEKLITETTTHHRHDHYRDTFKRDKYDVLFCCSVCGYKERTIDTDSKLIDRKHKGSHKTSSKDLSYKYKK